LAVALTTPTPRAAGPRAASRRAFRHAVALPAQPVGVEILTAITAARRRQGRTMPWDARLETSAIAVLEYLWRRAHGEKWAGADGSAMYACSLRQLVMGLAPIMGWRDAPVLSRNPNIGARLRHQRYEQQVTRFVKRHRKTVQRWLDWLQLAGLITHTPQQDEKGFWWRTVIELHPAPMLDAELLEHALERRAGWKARERRRDGRGRRRNLTAILRRARLTRAQRRARAVQRRRQCALDTERQRVRAAVAESLARAAETHLTHPYGASTTSRRPLEDDSEDESVHRRLTGAGTRLPKRSSPSEPTTTGTEEATTESGEELRWTVYREVIATRFGQTPPGWPAQLATAQRRVQQLSEWSEPNPPPRWRLIEAWTIAAHGPEMAAAGGFRLAFWRESNEHHGPRLDRALARYERYHEARPPGFPAAPIAGLAHFLAHHTAPQDGPEHGMAYDVQRFNELTKRMSAYAHYRRPEHLDRLRVRAERRRRARELATALNATFRSAHAGPAAQLRMARDLLDSSYPAHQRMGRLMYAAARRQVRLDERDQRLTQGLHPIDSDGRYSAAFAYARQWGLPLPGCEVAG
jgi:hypothetical protein